ncbi:MAG: FeoB-associated Cys-rich membrane protein [Eubacteriales bacterium]
MLPTIIVSVAVAGVVGASAYFTFRGRKGGCSSCGNCPYAGKCDK